MAEIEDLARELKMQVVRHELLAEVQAAALALGIEIMSREEQLGRDWATAQELIKASPTWKEGSAK